MEKEKGNCCEEQEKATSESANEECGCAEFNCSPEEMIEKFKKIMSSPECRKIMQKFCADANQAKCC